MIGAGCQYSLDGLSQQQQLLQNFPHNLVSGLLVFFI